MVSELSLAPSAAVAGGGPPPDQNLLIVGAGWEAPYSYGGKITDATRMVCAAKITWRDDGGVAHE